jgi:hypothetical protein
MNSNWSIALFSFGAFVGGFIVATIIHEGMLETSKQVAENEKICEERYAHNTFIHATNYELRIADLEKRLENTRLLITHWQQRGFFNPKDKKVKLFDSKLFNAVLDQKEKEIPGLIEGQIVLMKLELESLKRDSTRKAIKNGNH